MGKHLQTQNKVSKQGVEEIGGDDIMGRHMEMDNNKFGACLTGAAVTPAVSGASEEPYASFLFRNSASVTPKITPLAELTASP